MRFPVKEPNGFLLASGSIDQDGGVDAGAAQVQCDWGAAHRT
jgi:hypothetical protein